MTTAIELPVEGEGLALGEPRFQRLPAPESERTVIHRVISLVAVLGLSWPLFTAWDAIIGMPGAGAAVIALSFGVLVLGGLILGAQDELALARLDRWLLVLALLTIVARAAGSLAAASGYPTDEAAFTQGAINTMLHGHDPYGANLVGSLSAYGVPDRYWTYLMNGGHVTSFGYPALPLLLVTPFVWLTGNGQAVPWAEIASLMVLTGLVYRRLPSHLRGLAVITCVVLPSLLGFALSGLNVVLMLPFLVLALPRDGDVRGTRVGRRAICLGLAMSVNPLGWFLAPFVAAPDVVASWRRDGVRGGARCAARLGGLALGAFLVVNLPFILAGPAVWLHTAGGLLSSHALPYGQGLVGLTSALGLGGGAVEAYSIGGALIYVGLFILFIWRIDEFGPAALILPLLALFVSNRSLGEYWMAIVPAVTVTVAVSRTRRARAPWPRRTPIILAALLTPGVAALAIALVVPAPLDIHVLSAQGDGRTGALTTLRVMVENRTARWLRPFYSTDAQGQASAFWTISGGARRLAPHSTAVVTLRAAGETAAPPAGTRFVLQAVTDAPQTLSMSRRFIYR